MRETFSGDWDLSERLSVKRRSGPLRTSRTAMRTALLWWCVGVAAMCLPVAGGRRTSAVAGTQRFSLDGDLILGGLFPVSWPPCGGGGGLWPAAVKFIEAMAFAVERVNARPDVLPGIRLGFSIADTCWDANTAIAQFTRFALPPLSHDDGAQEGEESNCSSTGRGFVVGVVGPMLSVSSIPLARLAAAYSVPLISYGASSDSLSDKNNYGFFLRLVPPDRFQLQAIVALLRHHAWRYVAFLHEDDDFGRNGRDYFRQFVSDIDEICIAHESALDIRDDDARFDAIVAALRSNANLRVVVLFASSLAVRRLAVAVERAGAVGHFVWVAADSLRDPVAQLGAGRFVLGMLSLQMHSESDGGFERYFRSLRPANNARNPWFAHYWQLHFNCSLDNATGRAPCDPAAAIEDQSEAWQSEGAAIVIDIVELFANALTRMVGARCASAPSDQLANCFDGSHLLQLIRGSHVRDDGGGVAQLRFDGDGEIVGKYAIHQVLYFICLLHFYLM